MAEFSLYCKKVKVIGNATKSGRESRSIESLSKKFNVRKMPKEAKLIAAIFLMFGALYVFQLFSSPPFFKSQVHGVTGFIIDNVQKAPEPVQPVTAPEAKKQEAPAQALKPSQAPVKPITGGIAIVSPPKGSQQSPGFSVNIEVSEQVLTCYYRIDDNGQLTWDRRMKPCKTELPVSADHCKTPGSNTCQVNVEAYDAEGNGVGKDSALYSIK